MSRTAVVLFNLGGPDSAGSVEPFLYNLFSDPAIIGLNAVFRRPLARIIARSRARTARDIFSRLGGASPLLANTQAQAEALQHVLGHDHRCFVAMRYWHPYSSETASEVGKWAPDDIVLLPLYPQFSGTTTMSSWIAWKKAAVDCKLDVPTSLVASYPTEPGFIDAIVGLIRPAIAAVAVGGRSPRLLLTAHGLPKKIVHAGDPYPAQVEATAAAIIAALARPGLDWRLCYQSRVGPLAWLEPATDAEIRRAGRERLPLVVSPIAFVSEHSETLVELDLDYRKLAEESGVPSYRRVATVGTEPRFIAALAALVIRARAEGDIGMPTGWLHCKGSR
ncbi:MAG TPA: ferrochelatase [Stellaceae bacterium]|jgi:ferrochelatase